MLNAEARAATPRRVAIMLDLGWPYRRHIDVFVGTQRYAREHGWKCIVDEFVHETLAEASAHEYDGIIARATPEVEKLAAERKIPLLNVWFNSPCMETLPGVFADFSQSGKLAAEHLKQRGFRNFACLSGSGDHAQRKAVAAFHENVRRSGGTCDCLEVHRQYYNHANLWAEFRRRVKDWISHWSFPVGVFITFPDTTARHVADAVRDCGIAIPEQVAIIQSDNDPILCNNPAPSLSSVDVPFEAIGYRAAAKLDAMMNGEACGDEREWVAPTGIIARQSTDFLAVEDELVANALRCISEMAHQAIGVDDICEAACAGRRTLERRFQKTLGRTIAEEILRLRIERAKRDLAYTDTPIKRVARLAGFRDAKRMHEVFMREVHQSPSAFRNSLHSQNKSSLS